eukprot:351576-Prymnesium_polylepis.1
MGWSAAHLSRNCSLGRVKPGASPGIWTRKRSMLTALFSISRDQNGSAFAAVTCAYPLTRTSTADPRTRSIRYWTAMCFEEFATQPILHAIIPAVVIIIPAVVILI